MKRALLFLFLLISCNVFSQELRDIKKVCYTGYYNWGVLWVKAGYVEFEQKPSSRFEGATELTAFGFSNPKWDWVFKVRDTLISHFDPRTFVPYAFSRKAHEGSYDKTFDYEFDYKNDKVYSYIHRYGKYKYKDTLSLLPQTFDMLSVAWKARQLDFESFEIDERIPIRILLDNEILNLYVRYLGTDEVRVKRKKYKCYVFSPLLVKGEVFTGGESMKVYVSMDKNRIPILVESKIIVGSVKGIIDPDSIEFWD